MISKSLEEEPKTSKTIENDISLENDQELVKQKIPTHRKKEKLRPRIKIN